MAMSFFEARLAPMPKPYLALEEDHQDQQASVRTLMKRSHSFSGFVPYARLFDAGCQVTDLSPVSTAASQSEQPGSHDESVPSQWPDTDEELIPPATQASTATSHDDGECSWHDDRSNIRDESVPSLWPGTDEECLAAGSVVSSDADFVHGLSEFHDRQSDSGDEPVPSQVWPNTDEEMEIGTKSSWPDTDEELDSPVHQARPAFGNNVDAESATADVDPSNSFEEEQSDSDGHSAQKQVWPDTDEEMGLGVRTSWPDTDDDVLCPANRIRTACAFDANAVASICQPGNSSNERQADETPHVELDVASCSPVRQVPASLDVAMKPAPENSSLTADDSQLRRTLSLEAALVGTVSRPMAKSPLGPPEAPRAISLAEELVGSASSVVPALPQPPRTAPRAKTLPDALTQCLSTTPLSQGERGHSAACAAAPPKGSPVGAGRNFYPDDAEDDQSLADDETRALPRTCVTTMVIKKLPKDVSQQELLEELNASGFAGSYDFCYMPGNFKSYENKGYAFVNFISVEVVRKFLDAWNDKARFSNMPLAVSPAEVQGLEANLKKWNRPRMARIRNPNLKPFVLEQKLENCLTRNCPPAPVKLNLDAALQSAGGRILQPDGRKQGGRAGNNGVPEVAASGHQDLSVGSQASFVVPSPLCIPLEAVKMCTQEPSLTNARAMLPATSSVAMTPGSSPKDAPAPVAFGAQALSKGWPSADVPKALSRQLPTLLIRGGTSDKPMRTSSACAAYAFGLQAA
eukprot:TRINITY_DN13082_c0_g1_i1.p1 TRINITY_DN13082_c0_g1~~TRINITY_DN13082_c0_g1_i1.p1  ORF type:complete len:748 (+),score=159.14 TRINITY_DN13082_c0_g1_i1:52-2295(+)